MNCDGKCLTTWNTIAIDPSVQILYLAYRSRTYGLLLCAVPTFSLRALQNYFTMLHGLGFQYVVYESCYFAKNTKTYGKLYHTQETVRRVARESGLILGTVKPSSWQVPLLLEAGTKVTGIQRAEWKDKARAYVAEHFKSVPKSQDFCDALCILQAIATGAVKQLDFSEG